MFFETKKKYNQVEPDQEMKEGSNKKLVAAAHRILDEVEDGEEFFVLISRPEADRRVFAANNIKVKDALSELEAAASITEDYEEVNAKPCGKCPGCLKNK